jgi:hypothetical protein
MGENTYLRKISQKDSKYETRGLQEKARKRINDS